MVTHYTLTLNGSAQSLASVLPGYSSSAAIPTNEQSYSWLAIQADGANSNLVYVGGANRVLSSIAYGFRIEVPVSSIPSAPSIVELGGAPSIRLSEFQVIGTNAEKIYITVKE